MLVQWLTKYAPYSLNHRVHLIQSWSRRIRIIDNKDKQSCKN
jgi:hypothetical protein